MLFAILLCITSFCTVEGVSISASPHQQPYQKKPNSAASLLLRGGSLQSRRWERMDGKALGGSESTALQSSLSSAAGGRACSFYVWDAPSALLHRWCHHLLKDCVYEGLGGRKFVRIEPGSILQLLYPCSRYSPDRCIACGGSFRDHLTLWWAKHLYTPFDRNMDNTYAAGSVLEPTFPGLATTRRRRNRSRSSSSSANRGKKRTTSSSKKKSEPVPMMRVYAFHKRYVTDLDSLAPEVKVWNTELRRKVDREKGKIESKIGWRMEWRRVISTEKKMFYAVPTSAPINGEPRKTSATETFMRYVVLGAVDRLIGLQEAENDKIRTRERATGRCP